MQWEDHIKNVNQNILLKYSKIKAIASIILNTSYKKAFDQCTGNAIFKFLLLSKAGRLGKFEKELKNVHSSFLSCLKDLLNKNDAVLAF